MKILQSKYFNLILFAFLLLSIFLSAVGTLRDRDPDDKSAHLALSHYKIFSTSSLHTISNLSQDIRLSNNSDTSIARALERLSAPYNYIFNSKIMIPISTWVLSKTSLTYDKQLSIVGNYSHSLSHLFFLFIFFLLFLKGTPQDKIILWKICLALLGLVLFFKIEAFANFITNHTPDIGPYIRHYLPTIWAPRGSLGLLFMLQIYFFITKRYIHLSLSILFAPFIHLALSVFTNTMILIAFILNTVLSDKNIRRGLIMSIFIVSIIGFSLFITATLYQNPTMEAHTLTVTSILESIKLYFLNIYTYLRLFIIFYFIYTLFYIRKEYNHYSILLISLTLSLEALFIIPILFQSSMNSSFSQIPMRCLGICLPIILFLIWNLYFDQWFKLPVFKPFSKITFSLFVFLVFILNLYHISYILKQFTPISNTFSSYFKTQDEYQKKMLLYSQSPIDITVPSTGYHRKERDRKETWYNFYITEQYKHKDSMIKNK